MKYANNAEQIAGVLGMKLPARGPRRFALLAQINSWKKLPGWPAKVKGKGWPADKLIEFRNSPKSKVQSPQSNPDELQPQEKPAGEDMFNLTPEQVLAHNQERLKRNRAIYLNLIASDKKLLVKEINELVDVGMLPASERRNFNTPGGATGQPTADGDGERLWVGGKIPSQQAMAHELTKYFSLPFSRQNHIQAWTAGKKLPVAAKGQRFPPFDSGNGYSPAQSNACFKWVLDFYVAPIRASDASKTGQGNLRLEDQATAAAMIKDIAESEISVMERDSLKREMDRKWILRDVAESTALHILNEVRSTIKKALEQDAPKERFEERRAAGCPEDANAKYRDMDVLSERRRFDWLLDMIGVKSDEVKEAIEQAA